MPFAIVAAVRLGLGGRLGPLCTIARGGLRLGEKNPLPEHRVGMAWRLCRRTVRVIVRGCCRTRFARFHLGVAASGLPGLVLRSVC